MSYTGNGPDYSLGETASQALSATATKNPHESVVNDLFGLRQILNPQLAARSNGYFLGFSGMTDGALAATGVLAAVAVPVSIGDVFSKLTIAVGATAGATMTHQFAALYAGTGAAPALLGQSTDTTSAAIAASGAASWTFTSPITVTAANAPFGFIYAGVAITAATIPTAAVVSTPTAVGYKWFTNGPLFFSATAGSGLAGTAVAIASPAAKAVAPIVFLT